MTSKTIKIVHNYLGHSKIDNQVLFDHVEISELTIKHEAIVCVNKPIIGWIVKSFSVEEKFMAILKENGLGPNPSGSYISMHSIVIDFAVDQKTLYFLSLEDAEKSYTDIINIIS